MKELSKKYYSNDVQLLTLVTAGSVDDGKSTLIGRLLFDTEQLYEDQIEAIKKADRVEGELDFSLFTDGLSSEREQKITIDVAYRYFSTGKRRFIIADVPGHEQYTRNMVTGASKAKVGIILIDARKGILEQTKRHLFLATLMGIPHIAIVINKMDLVGYSQEVFERIRKDCNDFSAKMEIKDLQYIPASSLKGDMIVKRGNNLNWYDGRTVLSYLENVEVTSDRNLIDFRLPVQYVVRPNQDYRGYAGVVEGGVVRVGDDVKVLPSGKTSKIKDIYVAGNRIEEAFNPQSAIISLEDEIDISRGDMIVRVNNIPEISDSIEAMMCWFSDKPLETNRRYLLKHTTQTLSCFVEELRYRLNVDTLHRDNNVESLQLNDIGRVSLKTQKPIFFDPYLRNKNTGCFILIDELTNNTVGAGILVKKKAGKLRTELSSQLVRKQQGVVLWFTGLSGSGKSTIANALIDYLHEHQIDCERLDGDVMRQSLCSDLGFSQEDRKKNIERAGFVADMLSKHGVVVLASFISPYQEQRDKMKKEIKNFVEIFVDTPLEVCEQRDVKGLYKKARAGEIEKFTGISHPYESPLNPDIRLITENKTVEESVEEMVEFLKEKRLIF